MSSLRASCQRLLSRLGGVSTPTDVIDAAARQHEADVDEILRLREALDRATATIAGQERTLATRDAEWNVQRVEFNRALEARVEERTQERNALHAQLLQAQKLEAVGRLAGGIAHDFNNLLTVVHGYAEMILETEGLDDDAAHGMREIKRASDSASVLVRQLLTLSRRDVVRPRVIDLNHALADMHRMLKRVIGEDIEVRTVPDAVACRVKVDPGQIEQVVLNLAINARDAMPNGGCLTIEITNTTLDEARARLHVGVAAGAYVQLSVSDNGCGMSDEVMTRIFEPFFTTKPVGKGTGLGLATVYGIVRQHHGSVSVVSQPGQGTTFTIYLPCAAEEVGCDECDGVDGVKDGTETVLVVEDEPRVRTLAERVLSTHGYRVVTASNAAQALAIADETPCAWNLLLTDIVMPGLNGRELADRLRSMCPNLRVIFMSGYTDDAVLHHGVRHADVAFVEKPFTSRSLLQAVRRELDAGTRGDASSAEPPQAIAASSGLERR